MIVIGIDLSGPSNHKDTVAAAFSVKENRLSFIESINVASDQDILSLAGRYLGKEKVVIGIDAPLSYQDGGGDRVQDKALRGVLKEGGLNGSSIMTPTMTRMVYITLRGIQLSRMLQNLHGDAEIVEVHPGAAIGLRMPAPELALTYKKDTAARTAVFNWLTEQYFSELPDTTADTTHAIDACGAALAAWYYAAPDKNSIWVYEKTSAAHPFVMCC
ncbi:hypothetical protein KP77_33070 [Jeotgalibacillus alimentarius]|uniref:DUF429 domain-containing protein n=1 Tax=Jeotgalibacillus alimentarius TaxID=135826 RepID=A0A0C2VGH4_9BACL|nr:DUF429 domain-containing protein [Jeotgalibacillus alimentarius]KIL43601.1 hypothetical protein KP77_33070 [Jeotgalibacillus alimentarius]